MINVKLAELILNIATVFLNTQTLKDGLTEYKWLCCNKNYQQKFDEKLDITDADYAHAKRVYEDFVIKIL